MAETEKIRAVTLKAAIAIDPRECSECPGTIDFSIGEEDYIPEDTTRAYRHCRECGLINYFPPKGQKKDKKTKSNNRYHNWINNQKSHSSTDERRTYEPIF